MKKILLWLLVLPAPVLLVAQTEKKNEKIHYTGSYQLGIMAGRAYTPMTAQVIQGARYGKYEAGIGVSLDPYAFRTVPVFLHLAYSLRNGKNSPYAYADAGISIPWNNGALPEKYEMPWNEDQDNTPWHQLHAGFYREVGIGYKLMLNKTNAFTVSCGYSYKRFSYDEHVNLWNGTSTVKMVDKYSFDYHRIAFRFGLVL